MAAAVIAAPQQVHIPVADNSFDQQCHRPENTHTIICATLAAGLFLLAGNLNARKHRPAAHRKCPVPLVSSTTRLPSDSTVCPAMHSDL